MAFSNFTHCFVLLRHLDEIFRMEVVVGSYKELLLGFNVNKVEQVNEIALKFEVSISNPFKSVPSLFYCLIFMQFLSLSPSVHLLLVLGLVLSLYYYSYIIGRPRQS